MFEKRLVGADVLVAGALELAAVVPAVAVVDAGVVADDLFKPANIEDVPGALLAAGAAAPPKRLGDDCALELAGVGIAGLDVLG